MPPTPSSPQRPFPPRPASRPGGGNRPRLRRVFLSRRVKPKDETQGQGSTAHGCSSGAQFRQPRQVRRAGSADSRRRRPAGRDVRPSRRLPDQRLAAPQEQPQGQHSADRQSGGKGTSVSVRVDLGGRRIIKKKHKSKNTE